MNNIIQFFNKISEKIVMLKKSTKILILFLSFIIILMAVTQIISHSNRHKVVLFFPERDKPSVTRKEIRYLPVQKDLDMSLNGFISELLLGPFNKEYSPLFNSDTRVSQAFISNKSAYINITTQIIEPEAGVANYEQSWELFKKNVCTNYRSIVKIYLYINGVEVYAENPVVDAVIIK